MGFGRRVPTKKLLAKASQAWPQFLIFCIEAGAEVLQLASQ